MKQAYSIVVFIILLFFQISCDSNKKDLEIEKKVIKTIDFNKIKKQKVNKRKFQNQLLPRKLSISSKKIYNPKGIKVYGEKKVFLADIATQKIFKYELSIMGSSPTEYGMGRGSGPKYFSNIMGFDIHNDTLYVADIQQAKINLYSIDGEYLNTLKLKIMPKSIAVLMDKMIIQPGIPEDTFFEIYNKNSKKVGGFGKLIFKDPAKNAMLSDGILCSDGKTRIFYAFKYIGLLMSYDLKTGKSYYIKTIDKTEPPKLQRFADGKGVRAPHPNSLPCMSISYSNGKIYILSYDKKENEDKMPIIDVYNAENGEYDSSIKSPLQTTSLVVKDDIIYAVNMLEEKVIDTWILNWKYEKQYLEYKKKHSK